MSGLGVAPPGDDEGAPGSADEAGPNVQPGAAALGAQAATPTATRPPPVKAAVRRKPRRLRLDPEAAGSPTVTT
jgi:hypothetical protein